EGDTITYHWNFPSAHSFTPAACAGSDTCKLTSTKPGVVTVEVRARDAHGSESEPATLDLEFINIAPEVGRITCRSVADSTKAATYFNQDVQCSPAHVSDPNGDTVERHWSAIPGDANVTKRANCNNKSPNACRFPRHNPAPVNLVLTAKAGNRFGETTREGTAIFINGAPVGSLWCSGTKTNRAGDPEIRCEARYTDPNGDPLTFRWSEVKNAGDPFILGGGINGCTA